LFIQFKRKNNCAYDSRNRARTFIRHRSYDSRGRTTVYTIQETEQEHSYDTVHTIQEEEQLEAIDTQEKTHAELSYQERVACLVRVVGRPVSMALAALRANLRRAAKQKKLVRHGAVQSVLMMCANTMFSIS